jgi:hypothetical protein
MNAEFESNNVVLLAKRIYQWLNDNENDGKVFVLCIVVMALIILGGIWYGISKAY